MRTEKEIRDRLGYYERELLAWNDKQPDYVREWAESSRNVLKWVLGER